LIQSLVQHGASEAEALAQAAKRDRARKARPSNAEAGDRDWIITLDMEAAILLFLGADTQWRTAGMSGVRIGLDYAALPIVAQALDMTLDGEVFSDLKVIESGALGELAKRLQHEKG
jgi:Phage related hypothetical protein (DUF1799)